MSTGIPRRWFLGGLASIAPLGVAADLSFIESETVPFKLGVTTYSLRALQRGAAIELIKALKTPYISIKEVHLPYRSTPEELAQGRKEFENAGLKIMSGGTITLAKNDEADMRKYFDYARACGMPMMVCAPTLENLKLLERLVKEYDIRAAILNRGDRNFPTPQSVVEAVKDLDPRVGLCMDVTRAGAGVVESIAKAGSRMLDMHMKDQKAGADGGGPCDVGEGIVPVVAVFKQLQAMNYKACVNLEYEVNTETPQNGVMKSFAYMRGAMAGLAG
jgi:sugar phosphate isomerase/epimerase